MSLESITREVADEFGFPFETTDDGKTHVMECVLDAGRTQVVSATTLRRGGEAVFCVFTLVGPLGPGIELESLVARQMLWTDARLGIVDGDLVVCETLELDAVEGDAGHRLVRRVLESISIRGDALEEELFGIDEN